MFGKVNGVLIATARQLEVSVFPISQAASCYVVDVTAYLKSLRSC